MRGFILLFFAVLGLYASFLLARQRENPWPPLVASFRLAPATVIAVEDAGSLRVLWLRDTRLPTRIRAYALAAAGDCFDASEPAEDALFGREVFLAQQGRRVEGGAALLAFVFLDEDLQTLWQAEALARGLARLEIAWPEAEPFRAALEPYQAQAQGERLGLWGACAS